MKVSDYHLSLKNYVTRINNHLSSFGNQYFEERSLPYENGKASVGIKGAAGTR